MCEEPVVNTHSSVEYEIPLPKTTPIEVQHSAVTAPNVDSSPSLSNQEVTSKGPQKTPIMPTLLELGYI
jgi:hypothetical protein